MSWNSSLLFTEEVRDAVHKAEISELAKKQCGVTSRLRPEA